MKGKLSELSTYGHVCCTFGGKFTSEPYVGMHLFRRYAGFSPASEGSAILSQSKHWSGGRRVSRCHSGSDPLENPIRAGSDMLAISILP